MSDYDDFEHYKDYEEDYGDIREQVPKSVETIYIENEEGEEEEIEIEIDPTLLEIVDSQTYDEKSDDSMGPEIEHTLEGEIEVEIEVDGDTYFVEMRVWEYPINSVNDSEVVSIKKI